MSIPSLHLSSAWDSYEPGIFRLAGLGGAAFTLRSQIVPARQFGTDSPVVAYDVGFLSPEGETRYLRRRATDTLPGQLASFFLAAAGALDPETTLPSLRDSVLGLVIEVAGSTDALVTLDIQLVTDQQSDDSDTDGLSFETTRLVMANAAEQVRRLTRISGRSGEVAAT